MDFSKLFLLALSFWGVVVSAQTEASMSDPWTRDQTSRSLLQSAIPNTCNAETNVRWYDSPPAANRDITSAGACCELCQQTPGCRAWVWTSIGRVCYLLETVGNERFCSRCTGGILGVEPTPSPSIEEILQNCADDGGRAARAPAIAACIIVTDTCAPAAPEQSLFFVDQEESSPSRGDIVLRGSCDSVFAQTCRITAPTLASSVSPDCGAILDRGPGESREGCEDLEAATRIFNSEVAELCDPSD